mmetsp:Transcript_25621/g.47780  ORF Transcript_25621/g.47780 Transcript_25621/m.47780 type:complete len:99 (+) Transcript_25621:320-616(+)
MAQKLEAAEFRRRRTAKEYQANQKELEEKTKLIRLLEEKAIGNKAKRQYDACIYRERCKVRDSRLSTLASLFLFLVCIVLPIAMLESQPKSAYGLCSC